MTSTPEPDGTRTDRLLLSRVGGGYVRAAVPVLPGPGMNRFDPAKPPSAEQVVQVPAERRAHRARDGSGCRAAVLPRRGRSSAPAARATTGRTVSGR